MRRQWVTGSCNLRAKAHASRTTMSDIFRRRRRTNFLRRDLVDAGDGGAGQEPKADPGREVDLALAYKSSQD